MVTTVTGVILFPGKELVACPRVSNSNIRRQPPLDTRRDSALEQFRINMNQFDGNKSVFRVGAVRSAMPSHRASAGAHPGSRFDPPEAGCF